jgi:hypothetical protein
MGFWLQAKLTISACSWLAWTGLGDRGPAGRIIKSKRAEGRGGESLQRLYSVREGKPATELVFGKDDFVGND